MEVAPVSCFQQPHQVEGARSCRRDRFLGVAMQRGLHCLVWSCTPYHLSALLLSHLLSAFPPFHTGWMWHWGVSSKQKMTWMLVTTSLFPRGFGPMLNATWGCTVSQLISCLSFFLEVFVFFWGEGGRRLCQHNLQAGAFGVSLEGLQSWRQYGIGHLCCLLPVWFSEFHRCCGKKIPTLPHPQWCVFFKGEKNPTNPKQKKNLKQGCKRNLSVCSCLKALCHGFSHRKEWFGPAFLLFLYPIANRKLCFWNWCVLLMQLSLFQWYIFVSCKSVENT